MAGKFRCLGEVNFETGEVESLSKNCKRRMKKLKKEPKKYDEVVMIEKSQLEQKE
ncbi:MAG: hypothetical protein ABIA21_00675 [Candidatus Aenigmatarchaeota archaeon]